MHGHGDSIAKLESSQGSSAHLSVGFSALRVSVQKRFVLARRARRFLSTDRLLAKVLKHEHADGRRQVAAFAVLVDLGDQLPERPMVRTGDVPEVTPEGILEANARLVSADDDGMLHDRGFHPSILISSTPTR